MNPIPIWLRDRVLDMAFLHYMVAKVLQNKISLSQPSPCCIICYTSESGLGKAFLFRRRFHLIRTQLFINQSSPSFITKYIHQSGNKYFLLSISSSGSTTSTSFFFFYFLITDLAMIGLPFLFSLSGSDSDFCFIVFYCSSYSFFILFLSRFYFMHYFYRV